MNRVKRTKYYYISITRYPCEPRVITIQNDNFAHKLPYDRVDNDYPGFVYKVDNITIEDIIAEILNIIKPLSHTIGYKNEDNVVMFIAENNA